jgi:hypothetical protein
VKDHSSQLTVGVAAEEKTFGELVRTGADEYIEKVKLWCRIKITETRPVC